MDPEATEPSISAVSIAVPTSTAVVFIICVIAVTIVSICVYMVCAEIRIYIYLHEIFYYRNIISQKRPPFLQTSIGYMCRGGVLSRDLS